RHPAQGRQLRGRGRRRLRGGDQLRRRRPLHPPRRPRPRRLRLWDLPPHLPAPARRRLEDRGLQVHRRGLCDRPGRLRRGLRRRPRRPRGGRMIDVHFVPTPNGNKVTIMLEEIGLPYRLIPYNMLEGEHLTPEFRRVNPNGRLPAIVDHEPIGGGAPFAVMESGAILVYLSEKGGGAFMPADPRRRSQAQQWLMWQMAGFGPMQGQAHHFVRYAPEGQDYPVTRYMNETRRMLAVLDRRLAEADYLAEEYSV